MNPEKLKGIWKTDHFLGGVDTQGTLLRGSKDDVREEVKRNIETFAPGGGYVFAAVHNIQDDIPVEKLGDYVEVWKS